MIVTNVKCKEESILHPVKFTVYRVREMTSRALKLYRDFIRASQPLASLPSQNRRLLILKRVRYQFDINKEVKEKAELEFLFALGEVQLESVAVQAQHLAALHLEGNLKS